MINKEEHIKKLHQAENLVWKNASGQPCYFTFIGDVCYTICYEKDINVMHLSIDDYKANHKSNSYRFRTGKLYNMLYDIYLNKKTKQLLLS